MPDLVNTILANWETIMAILVGLHAVAVAIVNLTPTPTDDMILGKVYKVVEVIAGVVSKTAKEWPGERAAIKAVDELAEDFPSK
jgi:hypothetical protein